MIGSEALWIDVDCTGKSGQKYFGRFRIKKYLTHKERSESVRVAETLCRGITQDIQMRMFLATVAFVNTHVIESDAKWWTADDSGTKGMSLVDEEPVWEIANKINELQKPQEDSASEPTE